MTRLLLRGVTQHRFPATCPAYEEAAQCLNDVWRDLGLLPAYPKTWRKSDVQNAVRGLYTPGCIVPNPQLRELVNRLCAVFQADPEHVTNLIFNIDVHFEFTDVLVEQVALAVLFAAGHGVGIFIRLREMALLPSLEDLREIFPALTPIMLERLTYDRFKPGALPSYDFERLRYIFHHMAIPWRFCEICARVIAPARDIIRPVKRYNPSESACMDKLVQALFQRDISVRKLSVSEIIERLYEFDITRSRVYFLRKTKFVRHSIPDTRENRFLIQRVTKRLLLPCEPYLSAILAPRGE